MQQPNRPQRPPIDDWNANRIQKDIRQQRAAEQARRRRESDEYQYARRTLANLRYALSDPDLGDYARDLLASVQVADLADRIFEEVWRKFAAKVRQNHVLVQKESVGSNFHVVSFSSLNPAWEEDLALYLVDLLGPKFEEFFQTKRRRGK